MQKTVLITGCSSGIGLATAYRLRENGWRVLATARKPADVDRLTAEDFEALPLDVADETSRSHCMAVLRERVPEGVDALVNNAGYGQPGALEDVTQEAMLHQFQVNVFGLQALTNAVLPDMIRRGSGRIVHVSSVVGRVALPFMGAYSATKFAVEALADAQRVELAGTGVLISLVEPGPIATEFRGNAVQTGGPRLRVPTSRFSRLYEAELTLRREKPKPFTLPPDAVAVRIQHALEHRRPRRRYAVTLPAHLGAWASRLVPDALLDMLFVRELRQRIQAAEGSSESCNPR